MGGSIKEYLESMPIEYLENMLTSLSYESTRDEYDYALPLIEAEIKRRKETPLI